MGTVMMIKVAMIVMHGDDDDDNGSVDISDGRTP